MMIMMTMINGVILKGEVERMRMELDMVLFGILSRHLLVGTEGNNENWQ